MAPCGWLCSRIALAILAETKCTGEKVKTISTRCPKCGKSKFRPVSWSNLRSGDLRFRAYFHVLLEGIHALGWRICLNCECVFWSGDRGDFPARLAVSWTLFATALLVMDFASHFGVLLTVIAGVPSGILSVAGISYLAASIYTVAAHSKIASVLGFYEPFKRAIVLTEKDAESKEMISRFQLIRGYVCVICGFLIVPWVTSALGILLGSRNQRAGYKVQGILQMVLCVVAMLISICAIVFLR
jgi:hypothetical protein